ncbi:MAG: hypothetical protein KDG52_03960 [Rhodocyclaceae bacterium]|nr:hypothetical protein [Rhodocyclaceae bacterium]
MDRLLSIAIALAGTVAGLLLATGHVADVAAPLIVALAAVVGWRLQHRGPRTEP